MPLVSRVLEGKFVRLEPLTTDHIPALAKVAFDPDLWQITTTRIATHDDLRAYVDDAPAPMLAITNMMSMFGLHRALRGALVGHFAAAEITTAPSARRFARALRHLGVGERGVRFYTEHVEADAVHEQVLRHDVVGGLLESEPGLAADVVLGVQATALLEDRFEDHVLGCWRADPPRTSLRRWLVSQNG